MHKESLFIVLRDKDLWMHLRKEVEISVEFDFIWYRPLAIEIAVENNDLQYWLYLNFVPCRKSIYRLHVWKGYFVFETHQDTLYITLKSSLYYQVGEK